MECIDLTLDDLPSLPIMGCIQLIDLTLDPSEEPSLTLPESLSNDDAELSNDDAELSIDDAELSIETEIELPNAVESNPMESDDELSNETESTNETEESTNETESNPITPATYADPSKALIKKLKVLFKKIEKIRVTMDNAKTDLDFLKNYDSSPPYGDRRTKCKNRFKSAEKRFFKNLYDADFQMGKLHAIDPDMLLAFLNDAEPHERIMDELLRISEKRKALPILPEGLVEDLAFLYKICQ